LSTSLLIPSIDTVDISPNPVNHNASFFIAISVSEIETILEPIIIYCGTFYCGESGEI
jgi:hypothetical protein